MNTKYYQINGEIKKSDEAMILVDDYGLMRGYGIFETIRFNDKKLLKIHRHIDRLYQGLSIIKIDSKISNKILNKIKKLDEIVEIKQISINE